MDAVQIRSEIRRDSVTHSLSAQAYNILIPTTLSQAFYSGIAGVHRGLLLFGRSRTSYRTEASDICRQAPQSSPRSF